MKWPAPRRLQIATAAGLLAAIGAAAELDVSTLKWTVSGGARIDNGRIVVEVSPETADRTEAGASAAIDFSFADGSGFEATIEVQGRNLQKSRVSYMGAKFQFAFFNDLAGAWEYPNARFQYGTFPRQLVRVSMIEPARRSRGRLFLGLQRSSGRIEFDLATLRIRTLDAGFPRTNEDYRCEYTDDFRRRPISRGVMLPVRRINEDDFITLNKWGATLVRYQINRAWGVNGANRDLDDYDRWLTAELDHIGTCVLPLAGKYGIKAVIDMHVPPGGRDSDAGMNMFYEKKYADHFVACWRRIAERFKARPEIYGYDLVNEPFQMKVAAPGCDYWSIQSRAAEAIREIDAETPIIVECNHGGTPDAFSYLAPLRLANVIYQFHMYQPIAYTHQGLGGKSVWNRMCYPDPASGFDRNSLEKAIAPVVDFERRHGAKIYVGEFSAIAWAKGADRYIADCIDIFERHRWDWSYHAFREGPIWDVELDASEPCRAEDFRKSDWNPRKAALLKGFSAKAQDRIMEQNRKRKKTFSQ